MTMYLKPVINTGQQHCPITLLSLLSHFLRCYHNFFLTKPPKTSQPPRLTASFYASLRKQELSDDSYVSLPLSTLAVSWHPCPYTLTSSPVTGDELPLILSKPLELYILLPLLTRELCNYNYPLYFYSVLLPSILKLPYFDFTWSSNSWPIFSSSSG